MTEDPDDNHTADAGHLALWADVLRDTVEAIGTGVRIGALTAELKPVPAEFEGEWEAARQDAVHAVQFLHRRGGLVLCDMLHTTPEWILRRCREYAGRRGSKRGQLCVPRPAPVSSAPKHDLTGQRFGKLTAVSPVPPGEHGGWKWHCRCDCGGASTPHAFSLLQGKSRSCGCLRNNHPGRLMAPEGGVV
ncbi:MAG: hypothetical protein EOP87_00030 [Verrucomicrobiaceae bacterium]|nr:MAG: hypothetical protein EOP87_00030 [Verrucomicrobiaceae bacterium]